MTDNRGHLLSSYLDTYFITYSISLSPPPPFTYINHLHVIAIQNWLKQNYLITFEKVNNDTVVLWSAQNLLTTFHSCCVFTLHWQQQDCWTLPECLICIMITYRLRPPEVYKKQKFGSGGGKLIKILTFWGRLIQFFLLTRVKIEILSYKYSIFKLILNSFKYFVWLYWSFCTFYLWF